jgi:hypothetical protein
VRARRERTLLGLALVVSRAQVNQLVRPLPSVCAAMLQLHAQTQRQAALLAVAGDSLSLRAADRGEVKRASRNDSGMQYGISPEAALLRRSCIAV